MIWPKFRIFATQCGLELGDRVCNAMTEYVQRRYDKLKSKEMYKTIGTEESFELLWINLLHENNYYLSISSREHAIIDAFEAGRVSEDEKDVLVEELKPFRETIHEGGFDDGYGDISNDFSTGNLNFMQFSDGEFKHELLESVRGNNIFIIHAPYEQKKISMENLDQIKEIAAKGDDSGLEQKIQDIIAKTRKMSDNMIEELYLIDTLKSNHAARVHVFSPYRDTSRQDHKNKREGITAKLKAKLEETAGSDYEFFVELHSRQIAGFYNTPADNFNPYSLLINTFLSETDIDTASLSTGSPDVGGTARAKHVARRLMSGLTLAYKGRDYSQPNVVQDIIIIGDPKEYSVIPDDLVDTATTIVKGLRKLIEKGAKKLYALIPHALLSGQAVERLDELYNEGGFCGLYCLDSIVRDKEFKKEHPWYREVSIAPTIAETIYKISKSQSVSGVYRNY